jgi:hypothetical protein
MALLQAGCTMTRDHLVLESHFMLALKRRCRRAQKRLCLRAPNTHHACCLCCPCVTVAAAVQRAAAWILLMSGH